jgi:type III pantothenate kinase
MFTICFDFGNTRLKAAVFNQQAFIEEVAFSDDHPNTILPFLEKYAPAKIILSSVINHNIETETLFASRGSFHKLSIDSKTNFTTPVAKPSTIGADRIALATAAVHHFPHQNNLIIALGSCITYNFINQYNQFLGGAISPGLDMRFKALHENTAKLPLIEKDWNVPLIGYDTKTNIQAGVVLGIVAEIDGFIEKYQQKYGKFNAVLTGGNAPYFASQLKYKIFADVNFLFKGMFALSELNN